MTFPAPHAIQAFEQLFKPLYPNQEYASSLSTSVLISGSMYGKTVQTVNNSPAEVVGLFRAIILPAGAQLKGSMISAVKIDDTTWTVIAGLARNVNSAVNNCLVKASCTLGSQMITGIHVTVEVAPDNILDVIAKFLDVEGLNCGEIKACNY